MSLPELSVRRPIMILMVTLAVTTFGFLAARRLPVDLLPDLSYPTLTVQTLYPDAAPISVEQYVTRPIEEAVGVIPGVREMRSTSRPGISEVVLELEWGEDMDFVALDVREKLGAATLPEEVEPPRVLRFDPSLDPIVRLAFAGDRPFDEMRQLAERWLEPRLETVRGVAAVQIRGGLTPEILIEVDEHKLAALGLAMEDVSAALARENINEPGGSLRDLSSIYLVRTLHEFQDLDQVKRTVVREGPEGRIRVEDVAEVRRGAQDRSEITRLDGVEVVSLDLYRAGSANTVAVAEDVAAALTQLREELPPGLTLSVLSDQSRYIVEAIDEVWSSAVVGGLLAVLVLWFFLRDPTATAIIALSIPVSAVATFLPLQRLGLSLNIMSLGGLALGVGMLVDNSIVVLEAIDRRRREGLGRREAAIVGAGEVAGAVTASTLTTVAVFLPITFVEGVAGQLFYDQAVTVCVSLLVSLLVSLTLIPTLAAWQRGEVRPFETMFRWDRGAGDRPWTVRLGGWELPPVGDGRHWFSRVLTVGLFPLRLVLVAAFAVAVGAGLLFARGFEALAWPLDRGMAGLTRRYPDLLRASLRRRWAAVGVAVGLFLGSLAGLPLLGTDLVPDLSQGSFSFQLRLPEGTPLASTADTVAQVERLLLEDGAVARVFSTVGSLPSAASGRSTLGENLAQLDLSLPADAPLSAEADAVARVRALLARFPQASAELLLPSVLAVDAPVKVRIFADDLARLDAGAAAAFEAVAGVEGVADVSSSVEPGNPEVQVVVDREVSGVLGTTGEAIGRDLKRKIRGEVVGRFREGEERLDLRVRSAAVYRQQADQIGRLTVRLPSGAVVPVSTVAEVKVERGPAAIHRVGGARVAEITARIAGADLGGVLADVRAVVAGLDVGRDVKVEMAGQDQEVQRSFDSLKLALGLALFLVYAVMAAQFESLLHPLVILMAAPMGLIGIVAALFVTGTTVSVLVLIGAVMLAGIVVNNAIVLVDAVNRLGEEGHGVDEALVLAGQERLRPILMTTLTTVLALVPMALGLGAGDELRAPLAVTVIGGLGVGTILTLVLTPCLYRMVTPAIPAAGSLPSPQPQESPHV